MKREDSHAEQLRHELLADVEVQSTRIFQDHGIDADIARQAGTALADFLAEHWGGQTIGFPKEFYYKLAERDLKIYNEFNGNNHSELAKKYRMTTRGIYKLVARVHRREVNKRQSKLF